MPKSKAKATLVGQLDLFTSFKRQAELAASSSSSSKSSKATASLWKDLEAPTKEGKPKKERKRARGEFVHRTSNNGGGKENSRRSSTIGDNDVDDDDDVPLAALARPSSGLKKQISNRNRKEMAKATTAKSMPKPKVPPQKRLRTVTTTSSARTKPNWKSKEGGASNSIRSSQNPNSLKRKSGNDRSSSSSRCSSSSSMDTALEFLHPSRRKHNQDLSLKDIESHLNKKAKKDVTKLDARHSIAKGPTVGMNEENSNDAAVSSSSSSSSDQGNNDNKDDSQAQAEAKEEEADPDSCIDALQETVPRSRNLVHQLIDRSLLGSRGRGLSTLGPRMAQSLHVQRPPITAKAASWISLGHHDHSNRNNNNPTSQVDCMAWDPLGVLLAVAQTCNITKQSWIDIYDWDTVCAADRRGRNERTRSKSRNEKAMYALNIPPMLQFRLPSVSGGAAKKIPWIRWNPFHPDQLAVASRCWNIVYCINISHVESALASAPSDRISTPPLHSYWTFTNIANTSSSRAAAAGPASSGLFVDKDQIVLGFGTSLICYRYYPKRDPTSVKPKLKWQFDFKFKKVGLNRASIVSLETIGKEHIIAGSSHGHLALLQWKRVVTASATSSFSTAASSNRPAPTLVSVWLSYGSVNDQHLPQEHKQDPSILGIQNLQVEPLYNRRDDDVPVVNKKRTSRIEEAPSKEQLCGRFRIQWVTRCGWILSTILEASPSTDWKSYRVRRQKPRLTYQTTPLVTKLATGGLVTTTKKEWSLPTETLASDVGQNFVCWQKVAPVVRILPHHDKHVLDDQPSIDRDVKDSNQLLLFVQSRMQDSASQQPTPISLPRRRGLPKILAVDPVNQEWAVVATSLGHLYVMNLR